MEQEIVAMPNKLHDLRTGERVAPVDVTEDIVDFRYLLPITACVTSIWKIMVWKTRDYYCECRWFQIVYDT